MEKYTIFKDEDEIHVFADNSTQLFTEEEKALLWEEHKIWYLDGIVAVWVEERSDQNPIIHLMGEDDGHLFWSKERDKGFDSYWLDNYIETLTELKKRLKNSSK